MDSFSQSLHSHLASEPKALLALSRFISEDRKFDLAVIGKETGKKTVSMDFALNVMPIFFLNMESEEFEDGMWSNFPELPGPVTFIIKRVLPLWRGRVWRFVSK
jgi:hypothetical protein